MLDSRQNLATESFRIGARIWVLGLPPLELRTLRRDRPAAFAACVITVTVSLASGVRHPIPLYILLSGALVITAVAGSATVAATKHKRTKRNAMRQQEGFNLKVALPSTSEAPPPPVVITTTTPGAVSVPNPMVESPPDQLSSRVGDDAART